MFVRVFAERIDRQTYAPAIRVATHTQCDLPEQTFARSGAGFYACARIEQTGPPFAERPETAVPVDNRREWQPIASESDQCESESQPAPRSRFRPCETTLQSVPTEASVAETLRAARAIRTRHQPMPAA